MIKSMNPDIHLSSLYKLYQKERNGFDVKPTNYMKEFLKEMNRVENDQKEAIL